jgi:hypothetical protein
MATTEPAFDSDRYIPRRWKLTMSDGQSKYFHGVDDLVPHLNFHYRDTIWSPSKVYEISANRGSKKSLAALRGGSIERVKSQIVLPNISYYVKME